MSFAFYNNRADYVSSKQLVAGALFLLLCESWIAVYTIVAWQPPSGTQGALLGVKSLAA
jgi:hypothetical protein